MAKKPAPMDFAVFNDRFKYDPSVGGSCLVYKKEVLSGTRPIRKGTPAGCKHTNYWVIAVDKRQYKVHRIVWMLHKGEDFEANIDHINGDGFDNRIENLREATSADNRQNIAVPKNNKSGFIGVAWQESTKRWSASIMANGVRTFLGYYQTPEEGFEVYAKAKRELHSFNPKVRSTVIGKDE